MKKRLHRLDYYALKVVFERSGLSSPEVAEGCRVPFENFRKREKAWIRRLSRWLIRKKAQKHFTWHARSGISLDQAQKEWQNVYPNK